MPRLELKIPPLLLAVLVALLMWLLATYLPVIIVNRLLAGIAAGCLGIGGIICIVLGVMQFRTSRTTVNPMRPEQASTLVTGGIYKRTRNPMYVGMLLLLLGWAAWLGSAYALALPVLFVLYMNRFQIVPEETALQARFGDAFLAYCERVRRWL
ncbi:MAG TPA: isoprenylcysteine carboxylmethyltransferase family protein [Woeseiaceae bacterium]|nr:isoprenylcysteine carboxylmethyltransferase family protein [Woeseiaceae bacterium]